MQIEYYDHLFNKEEKLNTPRRHKNFMIEWTKKREKFNFTMFNNPDYKGMVIMRDISFASMCAHHLLPFSGKGHIGYIPGKKICGASKLIRALEMFASKPQTQEKLNSELINFLEDQLQPKGVIVVLEAAHDCMRIRGVKNSTSTMVTSEVRGVFDKEHKARDEFLRLIGK